MAEIIKLGEVFDDNGKKWLPVQISLEGLDQLNDIILGSGIDADDKDAVELRKQVHKDCIKLMDEFHPD